MSRDIQDTALYLAAGFAGTAVNAAAGGAKLFVFPLLLAAGLPPVSANATATVGIWPGQFLAILAYRDTIVDRRKQIVLMLVVAIVGSFLGATALISIGDEKFRLVIPPLIAISVMFTLAGPGFSEFVRRTLGRFGKSVKHTTVALVSIYGGFFGAGIGFLYLGVLSVAESQGIQVANATKNVLTAAVNTSAVIAFSFSGVVEWQGAILIAIGGIFGGYLGARASQLVPDVILRLFVGASGLALTLAYFL